MGTDIKKELFEFHKNLFREARAEWEDEVRGLPPGERYIHSKVLKYGYWLAYHEPDPEKQDAFRDWLIWPECQS